VGPSTTIRGPAGVTLSARGEFRGGMYVTESNFTQGGVSRSAWMPACWPYYVNPYDGTRQNPAFAPPTPAHTLALKPNTPARFVAMCSVAIGHEGYSTIKADYFKLRSISATFPVDFAFPQRVQDATLTITMNNVWTWSRESLFGTYGFENFGNAGITDDDASVGISSNERIPAPTTLRAALRITF
jgi:hypothetical protein